MTKFQYYVASSLDGFIADEHHGLDWLLQFGFDVFQAHYDRFFADVGAVVLGASTYEWILREQPENWDFGARPVWVLTHRRLPVPPDSDIRFGSGDVRPIADAARAGARERNVWIVGGGPTAAQFLEARRLDEVLVTYMPVALGHGKPLLPVATVTPRFTLVRTTPFSNGAVEHVYRTA
ncbi:MAG TPA: dihydrofolate reductase family protein [Agromyces sp.]